MNMYQFQVDAMPMTPTHVCLPACLSQALDYKPLEGRGLPSRQSTSRMQVRIWPVELSKYWLMCDYPRETTSLSRRWYILSLTSRSPNSDQGQAHKKLNNCNLIPKICKSHHRKHLWKELILFVQIACSWKIMTFVADGGYQTLLSLLLNVWKKNIWLMFQCCSSDFPD